MGTKRTFYVGYRPILFLCHHAAKRKGILRRGERTEESDGFSTTEILKCIGVGCALLRETEDRDAALMSNSNSTYSDVRIEARLTE